MADGTANFAVNFGANTFTGDIKIEDKVDANFNGGIANGDLSLTGINNNGTSTMNVNSQCSTISGSLYGKDAGLLGGIIHFDDVTNGDVNDVHTIKGVFYGGKD